MELSERTGHRLEDSEPPTWSLEDHLREGRQALLAIEKLGIAPQPICHHFSEVTPIDEITHSREETYGHLEPIFALNSITFASDRLEGWETARPDESWLSQRIPKIYQVASEHALIYEGWTWEPRQRQPIGACTFEVINNRTS